MSTESGAPWGRVPSRFWKLPVGGGDRSSGQNGAPSAQKGREERLWKTGGPAETSLGPTGAAAFTRLTGARASRTFARRVRRQLQSGASTAPANSGQKPAG